MEDVTMLLDTAIPRTRGGSLLDLGTKELVRGHLEAANQALGQLAEPCGAPTGRRNRANGDAREGVTTMWNKVFGGRLSRAKVDAVVRVIDRHLSQEAELRGLRGERQTIHPRDLPPDKRRALIEESFAILDQCPGRGNSRPTLKPPGPRDCLGRRGTKTIDSKKGRK